jgi:beta-lactamase regulating signal transducer with metallopeptidase domain
MSLVRHVRQRRKLHRKHVHLLRILTGSEAVAGSTLWLDVPHLMAYSLAGRPALVVASDGLRRRLSREAVAAVLEHERAHLRGRHHLLVAIAEALAVALPWLPLMRRSPALVRALVEISADSAAARSHGSGAVRAALLTMSAVPPAPAATLGMAPAGLALRLSVLSAQRTDHSRLQRTVRSGLAGTIAVLLPPFASVLMLTAATAVFCAG